MRIILASTLSFLIIISSLFPVIFPYTNAQGLPPIASWNFDEGSGTIAGDSSGNENTGTLINGPQWVGGISGTALQFDGINDYVTIPHSSALDITGNEITVEYWLNFPRGWYPGIPIDGDHTHGHIVYDKGDAYTAAFYDTTGTHVFNIPYVPPYPHSNKNTWDANTWYHIANVFDGSQIRIYVNGVLDKAETVIGSVSRSTLNLAIGSHCFGGMRFFEGILDEFTIYDYARTEEDIWNDWIRMNPDHTEYTLSVPYHSQDGTQWCSPTCLAMVLRYYGINTHSWNIAEDMQLSKSAGVYLYQLEEYLNTKYPWLTTDLSVYSSVTDQMFDDIKTTIASGYPVILALEKVGKRHLVVVVGYNETGLFINDPSGAIFEYLNTYHPFSYNQAFVTWDDALKDIIMVSSWPIQETLLIIRGNPSPFEGTLYLSSHLLNEVNPIWCDIYIENVQHSTYIYLDLNNGLQWVREFGYMWSVPGDLWDVKEELAYRVQVSNTEKNPQEYSVSITILGEDGETYYSHEQLSWEVDSYDQKYWPSLVPTKIELWNYLTKNQYYRIQFKLTIGGEEVDRIVTPKFYYALAGIWYWLKEPHAQQHLYLHVYDEQGNHVGLNYAQNETEIEIPNAYYFDDINGSISIVVPKTNQEYKVVIDGAFAEETTEQYNLTIIYVEEGQILDQEEINSTIQKGVSKTCMIRISEQGEISVRIELFPPWILPVLAIGVAMAISILVFIMKFRKPAS